CLCFFVFFFFFQAEDGIRDFHVTGVQTCALPISYSRESTQPILVKTHGFAKVTEFRLPNGRRHRYTCRANRQDVFGEGRCKRWRSEERRVGKEWRAGG